MKQFTYKQLVFEIGNLEHRIYNLENYLFSLKESLDNGNYKGDKNEQN